MWMSAAMSETMTPMLRPAVPEDVAAITDLVVMAFAQYTPLIGKPPAPALYDYAEIVARGRVTVAVRGAAVLGVVFIYPEEDGAMMLDVLAVSEAVRGQGLARRLIEAAEAQARDEGAGLMRVYTNAVMTGPQVLYPKLGYQESHRGESDGYDRIHYEKVL
jgi:GNAT superfamily N-acetyltransferase